MILGGLCHSIEMSHIWIPKWHVQCHTHQYPYGIRHTQIKRRESSVNAFGSICCIDSSTHILEASKSCKIIMMWLNKALRHGHKRCSKTKVDSTECKVAVLMHVTPIKCKGSSVSCLSAMGTVWTRASQTHSGDVIAPSARKWYGGVSYSIWHSSAHNQA